MGDMFPNLTSLKITSNRRPVFDVFKLIDTICRKCPKLKRFSYCGDRIGPSTYFFEYEPKFLNLEELHVEFDPNGTNLRLGDLETDNFIQRMENYFTAKCPKLKGRIQAERVEKYPYVSFTGK